MRVPLLIKLFTEDLDPRCKMRWVLVWLIAHFSGGLIHHAVVMSPGCSEFTDSTAASSSLEVGSNDIGMNSTMVE